MFYVTGYLILTYRLFQNLFRCFRVLVLRIKKITFTAKSFGFFILLTDFESIILTLKEPSEIAADDTFYF